MVANYQLATTSGTQVVVSEFRSLQLAGGKIVSVYSAEPTAGADSVLFANFSDPTGAPMGLPRRLDGTFPTVLFDTVPTAGGGFVVVYVQDIGADGFALRFNTFDQNGRSINQGTIDQTGRSLVLNGLFDFDVVARPAGGFDVSYTITGPLHTGMELRTASFSAFGNLIPGSRFAVVDLEQQLQTDITRLTGGELLTAYHSGLVGSSIHYRIVKPNGSVLEGVVDEVAINGQDTVNTPAVAGLANGNFVIAWVRQAPDGPVATQGNILFEIHKANGDLIGAGNRVVTDSRIHEIAPSVVALPDGTFVIGWENGARDAREGQRFDSAGRKIGDPLTIGLDPLLTSDGRILERARIIDFREGTIAGTSGNDILVGLRQGGVINGLGGNDELWSALNAFSNDTMRGGTGNDDLKGGDGHDVLEGGDGNDRLAGGDNDDVLEGGAGRDTIAGGDGLDTITYKSSTAGVSIDFGVRRFSGGHATGDVLTEEERLQGSRFDDVLLGGGRSTDILGGDGNDRLFTGAGTDRLFGEGGNDTLEDLAQNFVSGNVLDGGTGLDTVSYVRALKGVNVSLAGLNTGTGDKFISIENLTGSSKADQLTGNGAANRLLGGDGNDTLKGGAGNDTLGGGSGDDRLQGDTGNDTYLVEDLAGSDDTIVDSGGADKLLAAGLADITASVRVGNDLRISLQQGGSLLIKDHFAGGQVESVAFVGETFVLATGNIGGTPGGIISGSNAGELLDGRGGNDIVFGNGGSDTILGGVGNDRLFDGAGLDLLVGGAGRDSFHLVNDGAAADWIADFVSGTDQIVFDRASFALSATAKISDVMRFLAVLPDQASQSGFIVNGCGEIYFSADRDFSDAVLVARLGPCTLIYSLDDFALA